MIRTYDSKLVLADGTEFKGYRFGAKLDRVCEIVFNTAMVGYQEIVSDPSYTDQFVVMTYPIIGNYGVTDEDYETKILTIGGLVVREYNDIPSNFRYTKTLAEVLEDHNVPAIEGIDTRMLARHIRDHGSCRAYLCDVDLPTQEAVRHLQETPVPHNQVARVSCKKRWYARTSNHKYNVVAVDCGIMQSMVRCLNEHGCNVTVVPYDTPASVVLDMEPDGVFLSNGPGSPEDIAPVVELVKELRGKVPMFGACLGMQAIALAYGARVYKLKSGHHGGNYPVKELATGKLEITSQNHDYAICADSLAGTGLEITHVSLMDDTVQGLCCRKDQVFGTQYQPETVTDGRVGCDVYDTFLDMMKEGKENA